MNLKIKYQVLLAYQQLLNWLLLKIKFQVLVIKKTDYNVKVTEIEKKLTDHTHDSYITTAEFNKLKLVTKTDFDNKFSSLNKKIVLNKTRHLFIEK